MTDSNLTVQEIIANSMNLQDAFVLGLFSGVALAGAFAYWIHKMEV